MSFPPCPNNIVLGRQTCKSVKDCKKDGFGGCRREDFLLLQLIIVVIPCRSHLVPASGAWLSIAGPWFWLLSLSVLRSQVAARHILCVYIHLPFWMAARPRTHSPSVTCKRRLDGFLLHFSFWYLRDVLGEERLPYSVCGISLLPQLGGIGSVISILQECFSLCVLGEYQQSLEYLQFSLMQHLWNVCVSVPFVWHVLNASIHIRQSLSCQGLFTSAKAAVISQHAEGFPSLSPPLPVPTASCRVCLKWSWYKHHLPEESLPLEALMTLRPEGQARGRRTLWLCSRLASFWKHFI